MSLRLVDSGSPQGLPPAAVLFVTSEPSRRWIRSRARSPPRRVRADDRRDASDLLNRGVRLETVSKLLGHASPAVTARAYAHLLDSTVRDELLRALPTPGHAAEARGETTPTGHARSRW